MMKIATFLFLFLVFYGLTHGQSYSFSQHHEAYQDLVGDMKSPSSMKIVNKNYQAFGLSMSDTFFILLNGGIINFTALGNFSFDPLLGDLKFDFPFSELSYKIEDNSGDDILKFQWKDLTSEDDPSVRINLQLWIYEKDQMIEFRYGSGTVAGDYSVKVSYTPKGATDPDHVLVLAGDPNNPTVTNSIFDDLNGKPDSGTVFRFSFLPSGIKDQTSRSLSVYPNPGKGSFQVDADGVTSVRAFDSAGKAIAVNNDSGLYRLEDAIPGVYFLSFEMEDRSLTRSHLVVY